MENINRLPNPGLLRKLYKEFYIAKKGSSPMVSSHWEQFIPMIRVELDDNGDLRQFSGYGFGDLQGRKLSSRLSSYICNISYFLRMPNKGALLAICRKAAANLNVIGSYLSYDCFRQTASLSAICEHFKADRKDVFDVLIIGDGYGFLSSLMKKRYPKCRIVLADIGNVLFFQAVNLQKIFPGHQHCLAEDGHDGSDFIYCPTERLYNMKTCRYKLIINIASMQEMNNSTVCGYFDYIRENAEKDNFFYCCNRVFKKLPGGEEIKFEKYPWKPNDIHYIDEEPAFYRYFISGRYPFIRYFDGKMRHRLTRMEVAQGHDTQK